MKGLLFFDTETSHFAMDDNNRIIQLAYYYCDKDNVKYNSTYINPDGIKISPEAKSIHNILDEMVINSPLFKDSQVIKEFDNFNKKDNILIAHNLPFDLSMISKEGLNWSGLKIDTLKLVKYFYPEARLHKLQYLRYFLELDKIEKPYLDEVFQDKTPDAHDALFDVIILKLLFLHLKDKAGSINELLRISNNPIFIDKMSFGKYKGEKLSDIVKEDRNYLEYIYSNFDLQEDVKYSVHKILKEN